MPNSEGPGDAAPGSRNRDGAGNKWSSNGRARRKIELGSRRRTPHGYPDPYPRRSSGPQNPGRTVQAEDATMRSQISGSAPASVAADDAAATVPATISGAESDGRLAEGTKGIIVLPPLPKSARPLVCVASNTRNRTIFPEDGLCDYLIFHDVTLGDSEWVSATNRGKLDPFIEKASRSRQSVYMLSFPANIYAEVKSFLRVRDTSVQLIKKYATHNIRGYGFALIDRPVRRFVGEAEHYKDIVMNLSDRMKEAMNTGGVTFMGLLLRGNAKGSVGNELKELVKRVDLFVAISHTPLPDTPGSCVVQPISSWSSEHLNDASLQSIVKSTLAST
ncbi:uncharacterized protein LOC135399588 [Ornithodoros turicata]|uniref:uncharacterized protein LOC135399588 n=1 Tax=Ornithodoros turicata TaxID=34597 RepID=UPI003138DBF3